MSRTIVATVVKNEAARYWQRALDIWSTFADEIVVLDDGSTDETAKIAKACRKVSYRTLPDQSDLWGNESGHRAALWIYAMGAADTDDVVLWLDADMVPANDPSKFFNVDVDAFAFTLYDLWGTDDHDRLIYRRDGYWKGHENARIWAVRKPELCQPSKFAWEPRGIHSGHIPTSFIAECKDFMSIPKSGALLHYGYFTAAERQDRFERYVGVRHLLEPFELDHARTIMTDPDLAVLPFSPTYRLDA